MDGEDLGFKIFIGVIVIMGLLYTFTDFRISSPIAPLQTTPSQSSNNRTQTSEIKETPVRTDVRIKSVRETRNMTTREEEEARDRDPDFRGDEEREYVVIETPRNNTHNVNLTGWTLENRWGTQKVSIGRARVTTGVNKTSVQDMVLEPGSTLYVMSGEAPRGWFSARLNICHGYFNDIRSMNHMVSIQRSCPAFDKDAVPLYLQQEQFCLQEINKQRTCQNPRDISSLVTNACRDFIYETFSYNGCVSRSLHTEDFQKNEWRFYLDADDPLWDIRNDGLILKNQKGDIVDVRGTF